MPSCCQLTLPAEHTDGEDLSFTTAGGVAEGWLPDAGQQDPADAPADEQPAPEQGEAEQQAPEEQQGPGQQAALQPEADPTSSEAVMELLRHGKPEEALIRMAQRFGSGLQQQSFEDTISQVQSPQSALHRRQLCSQRTPCGAPEPCWVQQTLLQTASSDLHASTHWAATSQLHAMCRACILHLWPVQASERDSWRAERRAKELAL